MQSLTSLTVRESNTVTRLSLERLQCITAALQAGPAKGYSPTGPDERATILRQIGLAPFGTLTAISGGRVIPLPDGVELPVSRGVSVRVRLAGDDTYTVERVSLRAGKLTLQGQRTGIHAQELAEVAYRASASVHSSTDF